MLKLNKKCKKIGLTILITTILTVNSTLSAQTQSTCIGGTTFQANDGHEYCVSDADMTWWAAFSWCEAQRNHQGTPRHLVTWQEVCPDTIVGKDCSNLKNSGAPSVFAVTATTTGDNGAYHLYLSTGSMYNGQYGYLFRRSLKYRALCF